MSEKNYNIYLEFNYSNLNIAVFDKINDELEYYKEKSYKSYFNTNELNFENLDKLVEENIFKIEKLTKKFIRDVNLIIETPQSKSIKLSISKNNEGDKLTKDDAMYLVQNAKQQILKSNQDLGIVHIVVEKYVLDKIEYEFLPSGKKCNKISVDLNFICFPKELLNNFEKLFLKQQISINKFICSNYVKTFNFNDKNRNICEYGNKIANGINKQEVVSIPKEPKKKGFFAKLFHFFN